MLVLLPLFLSAALLRVELQQLAASESRYDLAIFFQQAGRDIWWDIIPLVFDYYAVLYMYLIIIIIILLLSLLMCLQFRMKIGVSCADRDIRLKF